MNTLATDYILPANKLSVDHHTCALVVKLPILPSGILLASDWLGYFTYWSELACIHFSHNILHMFMTHCNLMLIYCIFLNFLSLNRMPATACLQIYCLFDLTVLSNLFIVNKIHNNSFYFLYNS